MYISLYRYSRGIAKSWKPRASNIKTSKLIEITPMIKTKQQNALAAFQLLFSLIALQVDELAAWLSLLLEYIV